jgi:uncharacterized protein YodC (DUF2158 family)
VRRRSRPGFCAAVAGAVRVLGFIITSERCKGHGMPYPWKRGDLVRLRDGGRVMKVKVHVHPREQDEVVLCYWYVGVAYRAATFQPDELTDANLEPAQDRPTSAPPQ